jgi:polysaccharide biosynthesis PFTS motif protein
MKSREITSQNPEYRNFVDSGSLSNLRHLRERIMRIELQKFKQSMGENDLNQSVFFLLNLFNSNFAKHVFLKSQNGHDLSLPIPNDWMPCFTEFGYRINHKRSRFLLLIFLIKKAFIEVVKSLYFLQYIPKKSSYNDIKNCKRILFHSSFNNKHIFSPDVESENFGNWYARSHYSNVHFIYLNSCSKPTVVNPKYKTVYVKKYLLPLDTRKYFQFLIESLVLITVNIFNYNAIKKLRFISLSEEVLRIRFENMDRNLLPETVLLSESSGYIYPSWLKYLEQQGVSVQIYNFSTSDSPKLKLERFDYQYPWPLVQWKNVKVIDQYQKEFLKSSLGNKSTNFEVVGVPFYSDFSYEISSKVRYICLFDIMFSSKHFGLSTLNEIGANNLQTQQDILEMTIEYGLSRNVKIFYKQKRTSNVDVFDRRIIDMITEARNLGAFELLDPRISTHRLIRGAGAVISQAFTTTSIIAKQYNKPSFVLDLSNSLFTADPCLRNLPIISSKNELHRSLDSVFAASNPEGMI